jgi:hypothetical protein
MGLTCLKLDLGVEMVSDTQGTLTSPSDLSPWEQNQFEHPFIANEVRPSVKWDFRERRLQTG